MLTTGQTVLTFRVLGVLGAGGMGEVYRALDTSLGREVALKFLPPDLAENETVCQRFRREAQTLAALNHPCVAHIYGYHQTDQYCFLSLELVDGDDLSARLTDGPLSIEDAISVGVKIADGLEAAHDAGIVHRDLKPGNIRIRPDGTVKILDFGLATFASQTLPAAATTSSTTFDLHLTAYGAIVGTPAYMSPEQAHGLPTDHRTDIWSFGCVLFESLAAKPPFDGNTVPEIMASILHHDPNWGALPKETPASLRSLLRSCLQKEPQQRPESIAEVRLQLTHGESATSSLALVRARRACETRDWPVAFELLTQADREGQLEPEGLELLGQCARWMGHSDDIVDPFERAHAEYVASGNQRAAVRTALSLCHANGDAGRQALATAWWERATKLVQELPEGPEHAWHAWFHSRICGDQGDLDGQESNARLALELALRFGERNVEALALIDLSHVATTKGEGARALEFIKRATSLALGGEIDIFATGVVFCCAIWACRCRGEWQRAQEWTESASRWVSRQHVEYFPGLCRVHRSEVLRIRGELAAAEQESEAATRQVCQSTPAYATYPWSELGEVRRRRGDLAGAMEAFQQAISLGWDPQPGLALLLLQQGDPAAAHRAIEGTFNETRPTMLREDRANLLAARAIIALAAGHLTIAAQAAADLDEMAARNATPWDNATAAHTRGLLCLASGQVAEAIEYLTRARRLWAELETPYELANTCVLLGRALEADSDCTRARIELRAAHDVFARIGAEYDRAQAQQRLDSLNEEVSVQAKQG